MATGTLHEKLGALFTQEIIDRACDVADAYRALKPHGSSDEQLSLVHAAVQKLMGALWRMDSLVQSDMKGWVPP